MDYRERWELKDYLIGRRLERRILMIHVAFGLALAVFVLNFWYPTCPPLTGLPSSSLSILTPSSLRVKVHSPLRSLPFHSFGFIKSILLS